MLTNKDDIITVAKERYAYIFDDETLAEIESLGPEGRQYIWSYVFTRMEEKRNKTILNAIRDHVTRTVKQDDSLLTPTPFTDAERSISAGRWFSGSHLIPATNGGDRG